MQAIQFTCKLQVQTYGILLANCKCFYKFISMAVKRRSNCPISSSLDLWGDKWTLLIIRDLMYSKQCTYGDFLKAPEKIATNILASRLQGLEEYNMVEKLEHPDSKAKVMYRLTQKGLDMLPVLMEINAWAEKYFDIPEDRKLMLKRWRKDKGAFIKRVSDDIKQSYR